MKLKMKYFATKFAFTQMYQWIQNVHGVHVQAAKQYVQSIPMEVVVHFLDLYTVLTVLLIFAPCAEKHGTPDLVLIFH